MRIGTILGLARRHSDRTSAIIDQFRSPDWYGAELA